jgi:hypothetical protein
MCCSTPLQGIPSTPVTASHMTQGMDLHITLRHRQGVGLMGGEKDRKTESLVYLVQVVGLFLWVILSHSTLLTQQVAYLLCCCRDIMSVQSYQQSKTIYSHRHTLHSFWTPKILVCVCVCGWEHGCTNSWRHVTQATTFCMVAPNICGFSEWNLLHVTLLAPGNL